MSSSNGDNPYLIESWEDSTQVCVKSAFHSVWDAVGANNWKLCWVGGVLQQTMPSFQLYPPCFWRLQQNCSLCGSTITCILSPLWDSAHACLECQPKFYPILQAHVRTSFILLVYPSRPKGVWSCSSELGQHLVCATLVTLSRTMLLAMPYSDRSAHRPSPGKRLIT